MATERDGYTPLTDGEVDPLQVIRTAQQNGMVIEATAANGDLHSFVHVFADVWVAECRLKSGAWDRWLVHHSDEETIENCVMRCDPDVRLVREWDSVFGGDGGE